MVTCELARADGHRIAGDPSTAPLPNIPSRGSASATAPEAHAANLEAGRACCRAADTLSHPMACHVPAVLAKWARSPRET